MASITAALTRSHLSKSYTVLAPESHVPARVAGWGAAKVTILISPDMGSKFCEYLVTLPPTSAAPTPLSTIERFVYVVSGSLTLGVGHEHHELDCGSFAYLPPGTLHQLEAQIESRIVIVDKPYVHAAHVAPLPTVVGHSSDIPPSPIYDDSQVQLRALLPDSPDMDMAMNIMEFQPGDALGQVEMHVMEHGLLMLEGNLIYRLDQDYHPVTAGDTIYMAPYCPQWCACFGNKAARYLLYKNLNRDGFG